MASWNAHIAVKPPVEYVYFIVRVFETNRKSAGVCEIRTKNQCVRELNESFMKPKICWLLRMCCTWHWGYIFSLFRPTHGEKWIKRQKFN